VGRTVRTLGRAGLLAPTRPERLVRALVGARHWGFNYAGGFASAAGRFGDRPCVIDERGQLTWAEVDRRSDALASALETRGVKAGDVVGLLSRNHRGFVESTAALAKLGTVTLYLNTAFAGPQLREVLGREGASALLYDQEYESMLVGGEGLSVRVQTWVDDPGACKEATLDSMIDSGRAGRLPAPGRPGRSVILTSGTTGTPKGAPRVQTTGIGEIVAMLDRIPYHQGDTVVLAAPMFHSWGFANMSLGLILGTTMVLQRRFDPEVALADVARHRAEVLVAVPVMLQRILELPRRVRRRYDTSSLRVVPLSGSAIPGDLATRWMDSFGDNLYNLYGSTEVGWATIATPEDLRADPATAGRPPLDTVVKLLDTEGREVPQGAEGRIFVGSELLFEGYTGGGSKEVIDGLMSTGDTGWFDPAGRLRVSGRDDEMIVSGGENVFPREVEDLLSGRPDVAEASVIGVEDDEFGSRLKAFVVPVPGATIDEADLLRFVREHLARFKVPREVVFLDELPRNATGKVLKRDLS
jgi:fatty-acyl-CoA synthase